MSTPLPDIDLQIASSEAALPTADVLTQWVHAALQSQRQVELTIRIVDAAESQALNLEYRGKDKPTNVLSFPFEAPAQIELNLLGDLVICAPVVIREAAEQGKTALAHWAHMVVHGTLHLQGFDHIDEQEAAHMEQLEIRILHTLGFDDPYTLPADAPN